MRILLNSRQLLRLADPFRQDSADGRKQFEQHLVFGALGTSEMKFDVKVDIITTTTAFAHAKQNQADRKKDGTVRQSHAGAC